MLRRDHHTKISMGATQWFCYMLCCLMLLALGCVSGGSTRKASTVKTTKNVESSVPELSSRNQSLLALYSAEVETAADKVILESSSPEARRQALVWKAEAIPVMQTSLLNTDPVAALLDTWAFIFQMTSYVQRPALKRTLGESYPVVVVTLKKMDAEMERVVLLGAPTANVPDLRQRVSAWADAHPVQASLTGRQSADADVIRKAEQSDLGTMASIKALGESLGDLTARLDSYNAYLPKQARWQAELLLSDVTRDPQVSAALSNFVVLSNTAMKVSSSMDRMPELVGEARGAVKADIEGQRLSAQAFLREERLQTLIALQQQRIATIAAIHDERVDATTDLRRERQAVLDALRDDQVAAMNDIKAMSEKEIENVDARGRGLIDHFFVRALELMFLTLVLGSLVAWTLLRWFATKPPDRGERVFDRAA
jgi:hypothetical protein